MPLLLLATTALLLLVWVYVSYRKNKPITEKKSELADLAIQEIVIDLSTDIHKRRSKLNARQQKLNKEELK